MRRFMPAILLASLVSLPLASVQPSRAASALPVCAAEPDLSHITIATPPSDPVPLNQAGALDLFSNTLVEGDIYHRTLTLENTGLVDMALSAHVKGVDVPEFFTTDPTPVTFKVDDSSWIISPGTGEQVSFRLEPLDAGERRDVDVSMSLQWSDDLVKKPESLSGIYRLSVGATVHCEAPSTAPSPGAGPTPDVGSGNTTTEDGLVWTGVNVRSLSLIAAGLLALGLFIKRRSRSERDSTAQANLPS